MNKQKKIVEDISEKINKPVCKLIGEDGNVFNLIGRTKRTLKQAKMLDSANQMTKRCFEAKDYNEVLMIISEYVEIE
jgi:hypothetical protein